MKNAFQLYIIWQNLKEYLAHLWLEETSMVVLELLKRKYVS